MTTIAVRPAPTGRPAYESRQLLPCPESAGAARHLVLQAAALWQLNSIAEDAALVASELVANAVEHSENGTVFFKVSRPSEFAIRVLVSDKCLERPVLRKAGLEDERGRGLLLVDLLSTRWGVELTRWGKKIWADLEVSCG
ncbi:ATP-binding protein [Streptomyces sp. NPDC058989]|uniref:ATP-binding protein n=1 Tax=Streptomyces sp. NPDC058989 TaxID=3346686 RepID=UPI0036B18CF5